MWPKYNCIHFGCETSLPQNHRLKETQGRQGSFWWSSFQQCYELSLWPPAPSNLALYASTRNSSIQTGHSKAMHQNRLNWMRAFVVTMSALGNEDVLTVGSPYNSKWTRIINFPHTLLHFRTVGGPGILFLTMTWLMASLVSTQFVSWGTPPAFLFFLSSGDNV